MKLRHYVDARLYRLFIIFITLDSALYNVAFAEASKETIHTILLYGSLACALLCIIAKKYEINKFLFMVLLYLFALFTYMNSAATAFMLTILTVILSDGEDVESTVKIMYRIRLTVLLVTVALALIGILPIGRITSVNGEKGVLLGYGHANSFAGNVGVVLFLMIAVKRKNFKLRNYLMFLLVSIVIFYLSRSRIELVVMGVIALILPLILWKEKIQDTFMSISKGLIPGIVFVNFALIFMQMFGIAAEFIDKIGVLFNGRIFLAMNYIKFYGLSLLGKQIDRTQISSVLWYTALDNGYTYLLLNFGIVGLVLFVVFQQMGMLYFIKSKDAMMCLLCLGFCIWGVYEGMMVSAQSNFTLIYAAGIMFVGNSRNAKVSLNERNT